MPRLCFSSTPMLLRLYCIVINVFFSRKCFLLFISLFILVTKQSSKCDNGVLRNLNLLLFVDLLAPARNEMWSGHAQGQTLGGEGIPPSYPQGHCSRLKLGAVDPLRVIPLPSREPYLGCNVWQLYSLLILKFALICVSQTAGQGEAIEDNCPEGLMATTGLEISSVKPGSLTCCCCRYTV